MTHIKPRPVPTNGGGSLSCCECVGLPNLVMIGRGFVDSRKIDCSDPQSYYNVRLLAESAVDKRARERDGVRSLQQLKTN